MVTLKSSPSKYMRFSPIFAGRSGLFLRFPVLSNSSAYRWAMLLLLSVSSGSSSLTRSLLMSVKTYSCCSMVSLDMGNTGPTGGPSSSGSHCHSINTLARLNARVSTTMSTFCFVIPCPRKLVFFLLTVLGRGLWVSSSSSGCT